MEDDKSFEMEGIPDLLGYQPQISRPHDFMHRNSNPCISRSFSGTSPSFHHIPPPTVPRSSIGSFDLSSMPYEKTDISAMSTPYVQMKRATSMHDLSSSSSVCFSDMGSYSVSSSPSLSFERPSASQEFASMANLSFPLSRSASNLHHFAAESSQDHGIRRIKSVPTELHDLDSVRILL
jgi:hypothetical protein